LRDKHSNKFDNQLSTPRSPSSKNTNTMKANGFDLTPTPPVNGHAKFVRHTNRRSLTESLPQPNRSSPVLSIEPLSRTINYGDSSSMLSNRPDHNDDEDEGEINRQRYRPPSSTANSSITAPPVKPRKSSTTPSISLVGTSKPQQNHHQHQYRRRHHVVITSAHSDGDEDDEKNSLEGHGGLSDFDEDDQSSRPERPNSRLALRPNDDRIPQQQQQQQSNVNLRRSHYKQAKHVNRHSMYDDLRFIEEQQQQQQQQQPSSFIKSKQQNRPTTHKEFSHSSSNRVGSGSGGNQSATNRLKSGSKSSTTETIPALDLTVAGQKVFRTKQQADTHLSNSLPPTNAMRPPSGRLKPISSAKSTSSYTDELSPMSPKALEDVTNNGKQISSLPAKTHLYKKKLAPLTNSNDIMSKKIAYRSSIEQQPYMIDDAPSDRSEETSGGTSTGGAGAGAGGGGRDIRSSSGSDKRSKHH
jgi:hypothetical protein